VKRNILRIAVSGILTLLVTENPVLAQIGGINPVNSFANLKFNDTLSLNPSSVPGSLYSQLSGPWVGLPSITLNQTDSTTLDYAYADVSATYLGPNYSINFSTITLTQPSVNTGMADLYVNFYVEYTLSSTLGSQFTLFPTLFVNGTVQPASSSYALVNGTIDYYAVNSAGLNGIVDSVRYSYYNTTPGPFSTTIFGIPGVGTTPLIPSGSTLGLAGNFQFEVDPASFSVTTVPEPGLFTLIGLAGICGLMRRRR
jgi:hypothetical protein